jgi:RNA polymerase sporulation-specific sigma factor
MTTHLATVVFQSQKAQREVEDRRLAMKARNGDLRAQDELIRRYTGFVRLKASSYFLAGGEAEDLIQEGLIGTTGRTARHRSAASPSYA